MIEIEVRGFQSIEQVHLKVEHFTALVGRTNIGKSAIVRALKAALTNALGTSFVRHGATCLRRTKGRKTCKCEAYVHIHADNFDLVWRKGDDVNAYEYNGKSMTVPGRGFPEFLAPQFAPVKMGENQKLLQVSDQFFPLFLLDEGGATVANILSDVARLDAINVAMKMAEKDRKDAASLRKVRDKDVETLKVRLQAYVGLDHTLTDASDTSLSYASLLKGEQTCSKVATLCTRLGSLQGQVAALDGVEAVAVPETVSLVQAVTRCVRAARLSDQLSECVRLYKSLEGSAKIVVPDVALLRKAHTDLGLTTRLSAQYAERSAVVESLDGVDTINVPTAAPLRTLSDTWGSTRLFHDRLLEQGRLCAGLDGVDAIAVPDVGTLPSRGHTLSLTAGWIVRLREFKLWFDERKAADAARTPDATPLKDAVSVLVQAAGLCRRQEVLTKAVEQIEQQLTVAEDEHEKAGTALTEFLADARRRGLLCPACAQPIHGEHPSHTESADGSHQLPV